MTPKRKVGRPPTGTVEYHRRVHPDDVAAMDKKLETLRKRKVKKLRA